MMEVNKPIIYLTAFYEGEKYALQTYEHEYRNLMALLSDRIFIDDFGECKGMGRCGTCVVKIAGLPEAVNILERNEERTLFKTGITGNNIRLACQVLVDENLENISVEIIGAESVE